MEVEAKDEIGVLFLAEKIHVARREADELAELGGVVAIVATAPIGAVVLERWAARWLTDTTPN